MEEVTQSASIPTTTDWVAEEEDVGEILSDVQLLIQHLAAEIGSWSEPTQYLGKVHVKVEGRHSRISYWLFDTVDCSYKSLKECPPVLLGAKAKLRLLQAIGRCRTLRQILVSNLTGNDLEAVLTPLQSNLVLRSILINSENSSADNSIERTCEILGRILRTSRTLAHLRLILGGITAAGASHLASGVRGNARSALRYFYMGTWNESSVANQVAEIVLSAPRLEELRVYKGGAIDEDGIVALSDALGQSRSLKRLEFQGAMRGASALLLKALTGDCSNKSITSLELAGGVLDEGIGDVLPLLLSASQSLKELSCGYQEESPSASQWRRVGQSLSSTSSLELFRIGVPWSSFRGQAIDGIGETLLNALGMRNSCAIGLYLNSQQTDTRSCPWNSPSEWKDEEAEELLREVKKKKPIVELHLHSIHLKDKTRMWNSLGEALNSKGSHISSLYLQMSRHLLKAKEGEVDNFFQALQRSSTLRLLTIDRGNKENLPGGWTKLIDSLRSNISITHLRLIDCDDLDEDVFKQFMGVLHVNLTLKRIRLNGTSWETDGKKALIEEALKRNAEQDSYFSTFRRHGLQFQPATNCRLFLCGSPHAGKTRLRKTMTRVLRGTSWLEDKVLAVQLWRTKGVEVKVLKDDEEMQLAVWDLAGQWIFRTLQNILFPQTNHASVFLFVFSPYDRESGCIREDLDECFKTEFDDWLRFIASNSQITGRVLPKVLVVISHMDKMQGREVQWAESIIKEVGDEFRHILDVCENLYKVNACSKTQVTPLKDFVFEVFRDLLRDKTPIAPRACAKISSLLAKKDKCIEHRPLWSSLEFYRFCSDNLQADIPEALKPETAGGLEVFKAIASYLHDTGSIIIISSLDKIIVDPNWLTYVFLGELITMGHNFQVNNKAVRKSKVDPLSSKTGFVSSSDLESLLSSFRHKHPEFRGLDSSLLENLLIHFDLCYRLENKDINAKYYMPTIVSEDTRFTDFGNGWRTCTRSEPLFWSPSSETNQQFIGFRVECENPRRMSMTAALYPRFQIYIRQKLMDKMKLTGDNVICSRNYLHLHMDGHEILVERSDMTKSHIDVMVKCSQHKSREIAVKYIEEHIIEELRQFCASPRGCPGIVLVVGILRTECVEKLVPVAYRGDNQAILIQKLKENFKADIKNLIGERKIEAWRGSTSSLLNYEHYWPPIPGYLPRSFELAKELLSESEVENLTKDLLEKHEQQVKLVDQVSQEMSEELDQAQFVSKVISEDGHFSTATEDGDPCSSSSDVDAQYLSGYTSQPTIGHVLSRIDRLEQRIDGRFDGLEITLKRIEKNMDQFISLQRQLESSMSNFMSKLDKMVGYAESLEQSRTPKRPYLRVDNENIFLKVVAAMQLGTAVRLHFMCESTTGPHIVKDQPGLHLRLHKENMQWLRCIYDISLKMMYYLLKAGLHVTLGLGHVVPELGSANLEVALPLSTASAVVDDITITDSFASVTVERSTSMTSAEAWSRLRSILAPQLENNYTELFKLYRVKYLNLKEEGYAWVCEECMARGIRNRNLQSL